MPPHAVTSCSRRTFAATPRRRTKVDRCCALCGIWYPALHFKPYADSRAPARSNRRLWPRTRLGNGLGTRCLPLLTRRASGAVHGRRHADCNPRFSKVDHFRSNAIMQTCWLSANRLPSHLASHLLSRDSQAADSPRLLCHHQTGHFRCADSLTPSWPPAARGRSSGGSGRCEVDGRRPSIGRLRWPEERRRATTATRAVVGSDHDTATCKRNRIGCAGRKGLRSCGRCAQCRR